MVRKRYISEAIAVVNSTDGDFAPQAPSMTVWNAFTGGTQQTSLLDAVGNAISVVTPVAANGYQCVFDGPDGYTGALFLEDAKGIRHIVFPSDLGDRLSAGGTVLTSYLSQIETLPDYPASFPPDVHTHDDRYYTQAEVDNLVAGIQAQELLTWHVRGNIAVTGDTVVPIYNDALADRAIVAVRITVGTAPATTPIIVDFNVAGTTIFTTQANRPTIAVGQLSSGKKTNMDVTNWPVGAALSPAIDQVGSTTAPGADMIVQALVR
jgi:hypothetical protein